MHTANSYTFVAIRGSEISMSKVVLFPTEAPSGFGLERVRSTYTAGEISRQFGVSLRYIRRWTEEGLIPTAPTSKKNELRYDYRGLNQFRRVREMRGRGLTLKQVDAELHGQLNLFPEPQGRLLHLPQRLDSFEEALLLHERRDGRAAELYRQAIEEGECLADAYCNLGIWEFEAGRLPKAFDCFTRSLKYDPRHFESHYNLATLYFENGELRLARLHYELAAEIEPSFSNLHFNLGLIHAMNGDLESASLLLKRARDLSSDEERVKVEDLLQSIESALGSTPNEDRSVE